MILERNLRIINFVIVSYFILLGLSHYLKLDFFFLAFFRELMTIPFLLAQIVFLVIGITYLVKNKCQPLTKASVALLAICSIVTIGSFF
jgi:uncharacterized membrane protein